MTEKNIETLIGLAFMIGMLFIVYYFIYKIYVASNQIQAGKEIREVIIDSSDKTFWDKLKIVSTAIAGIAALIYAVSQLIEVFTDK